MLRLLADLLQEHGLGLVHAHLADALQGREVLQAGLGELLPLAFELLLLDHQLAVALLEHVRALVELLVALEQAALEVGEVGALGAALLVELALHPHLLVLGLEDQLLLLRTCLGDDPACLLIGSLDRLVGDDAASDESDAQTDDDRGQDDRDGDDIGHCFLPSSRLAGGTRRWSMMGATERPAGPTGSADR